MSHDRRLVGTIEPRIDHRNHFQTVLIKKLHFSENFQIDDRCVVGNRKTNSDGVTILHIYSLEAWQPNDGSKGKPQKSLLHLGKETLSKKCPFNMSSRILLRSARQSFPNGAFAINPVQTEDKRNVCRRKSIIRDSGGR